MTRTRTTRDLCQTCWEDANPGDYCPDLNRYGPCAECGAEALVTRSAVLEPEPGRVTAAQVIAAVHDGWPEIECTTMQTGGGTATVYVGPPDDSGDDGTRFPYAIGPGSYNWCDPSRSLFNWDDLYAGPDDDGQDAYAYRAVTCPNDVRAYFAAARDATLHGRKMGEYRHPAATDPDYRGPTANETAAEDAEDDAPDLRPDTVYRTIVNGTPCPSLCGRCLVTRPERWHGATTAGPTAGRCYGCGLDGAGARWAVALRGADLWRGLLVGLDGLEVDPMTGRAWAVAGGQRPGLRWRPWRSQDVQAGARWVAIVNAARTVHGSMVARVAR